MEPRAREPIPIPWWSYWYCVACVLTGVVLGEYWPRQPPRLPDPIALPADPCDFEWPCMF